MGFPFRNQNTILLLMRICCFYRKGRGLTNEQDTVTGRPMCQNVALFVQGMACIWTNQTATCIGGVLETTNGIYLVQ